MEKAKEFIEPIIFIVGATLLFTEYSQFGMVLLFGAIYLKN